jgi:hypothetical protein
VTDREVVLGCARVRIKCTEKTSVGLWGQSRDPRELPGVTGPGHGVAGVLQWARPGARPRPLWCGWPLAPLRLIFSLRNALVKIEGLAFVSSNSENISCVTFLKHKNSRKQGTGTVASC